MNKAETKKLIDAVVLGTMRRMGEEASSEYKVATSIAVDWCPCCGINIRLFENGKLFAKFIASPEVAKAFGCDVLRNAHNYQALHKPAEAELRKCVGAPSSVQ